MNLTSSRFSQRTCFCSLSERFNVHDVEQVFTTPRSSRSVLIFGKQLVEPLTNERLEKWIRDLEEQLR